ncbi:MAG: CoA pyrophosphatase, partial [Mangrovimonas sp.]|nr:CoA pyrophosphatase [Mangrovimonas sp.]
MEFKLFLDTVSKIRNLELPGEKAHFLMFPPYRMELMDMMKEKMAHAKKAAVMVLFYPDSLQRTNVVLILRKTYKGVHSAQIGFPGGKVEKEDKSLLESAVRETEEEVGVKRHDIDVLKSLSNVYIPPSNYSVYPFIG